MSQAWQIARRLLFQNRWLYLLLILWPLGMALAFDLPGFGLEQGDVLVLLHQESLYGLAFVCFTASVQLGNEQRSRRIVGVLSRAVSRSQYLFALLCAAWLPLALYAASFLLGGLLLAAHTPLPASQIVAMTVALLALGLWTAAVSLFFAAWLVPLLASAATLALISGITLLGRSWPLFGLGPMLGKLAGVSGAATADPELRTHGTSLAAILAAALFFAAAVLIFERRDLRLKED